MHCPSIPGRPSAFRALWCQLGGAIDTAYPLAGIVHHTPWTAHVVIDRERSGAWWTAQACWQRVLSDGVDFGIVLNDDASVPIGFVGAALGALTAAHERAPRSPVCFYTANDGAPVALQAGCSFYTTPDGLVGVGCGMHRDNVRAFLEWHARSFLGEHSDDGRINVWAMATKRRILTTVPSLVGHQLPNESTQGNAGDAFRTPIVPPPAEAFGLRWDGPIARFGRQYRGNHWRLLTQVHPQEWHREGLIEEAYRLEREKDFSVLPGVRVE